MRHDKFVTLWRPKNAGYCWFKDMAGFYESPQIGYHDNDDNMPLPTELSESLFQEFMYDGNLKMAIPNNKETWKLLGAKMTRDGLQKRKERELKVD